MRLPRLLPLLALVVAGCAASVSTPTSAPTPGAPSLAGSLAPSAPPPTLAPTIAASAAPSAAPTADPTASPTPPLLGDPVPAALRGTWQVQDPTQCAGCGWFLTLSGRSYAVYKSPLDAQSGPSGVSGTTLILGSLGDVCSSVGRYRWSLHDASSLKLTLIGSDPCSRGAGLVPYNLRLISRDETVAAVAPLTGPVPLALQGTWASLGSDPVQKFVFGRLLYGAYTTSLNDVAAGPMGAQDNEFSMGPRSDGGCAAVGLYQWTLVSPTRLDTVALNTDLCPRADFLAAGHLRLVSRALDGLPPGSGG